jgi:hypothetical protein
LLNNVFYSQGSFEKRLTGEFEAALSLYQRAFAYVIQIFYDNGNASIDWQVVINNNNGRGKSSLACLLTLV